MTHFNQRCRERGIVSEDVDALFGRLVEAIASDLSGQHQAEVEHVFTTKRSSYWRFHCEDGIFYAVTKPGQPRPVTVYNQEMMRHKKWARKAARRKIPLRQKYRS